MGSGASVPFDKPTTSQLKNKLQSKYGHDNFHDFVLRTMLDVYEFKDIEYVLQSITDIVNFSSSLGNTYFKSLTHTANLRHTMMTYNGNSYVFEQVVEELKKVYETLKKEIFLNYSWTTNENKNLISIYQELFQMFSEMSDSIRIFTTNYDQAIEHYCELEDNLRLVDGFKHDENKQKYLWANGDYSYFDKIDDKKENVYLYKLHGSLNWKENKIKGIERVSEESMVSDPKFPNNVLVYPTLTPKDGLEKEPFRQIYDNFKQQMKQLDYCIVIGFSFRDRLNEIFREFLEDGKTIIVFSPTAITDFQVNVLNDEPNENDLKQWESLDEVILTHNGRNGKGKAKLIQKKLEPNTIKEIIHDVKRVLEPNQHPF